MNDDIIKRLRAFARGEHFDRISLLSVADEAADEIEKLRFAIRESITEANDISAMLTIDVPMTRKQAD